eukprot:CAMPEP_0115644804 /NCGR_PEP_ID=MMETSP0272-20121206/38074_1 /TAXON_ID=71861 /ORGANISM="Scrippsiella trochoidea, Strain CCMP3099" /LENGTH=135 /DNA_ID=CAMNT_0003082253 /DNA_START=96 /DNA_END=503 /DNA_ORIENTATION=-
MALSVSAASVRKANVLVKLVGFWALLMLPSSMAAAPQQVRQSTSASSYTPEEYYMEEEEEEDDDTTVMIQVGVSTSAPKKRVTGIQPSMDDDCGWGEPCDEEEEDGAMLFQERVVKRSPSDRRMLEESEFDDSSI